MQAMRSELDNLKATVKLQALVIDDATSVVNRDTKYRGNAYPSYKDAVNEIASKYEGTADWGVLQTGNIIDVRASFISGGGLKVFPKDKKADPAQKEMEFVERFLKSNNLDKEMVQEFAINAEIEGRFLGELFWEEPKEAKGEGDVALRFRSWNAYNYTVETAPKDYAKYTKITWTEAGSGEVKFLDPPSFVYGRFGGRVHQPDSPYPKVGKCLTQIEDLDRALKDWREINRLFGAPKPDLECETKEEADKAKEAVANMNWKIKTVFIHTGTFSYKSPTMEGAQSIENEIITKAKMISGTTGVPVQFLGLPDIASLRASSSENLTESISAATQKERIIWKGLYQEIITKAMALYNSQSNKTQLDPAKITIDIPYITESHWQRVKDIWLLLYTNSAISLKTLLSQIPDIDVEAELAEKEERDAEAIERFKQEADQDDEDDEEE
jgi:hypothetical protein